MTSAVLARSDRSPPRPSVLVIGPGHPWVRMEGSLLRFRACLRSIADVADATYLGVGIDAVPAPAPPCELNLESVHGVGLTQTRPSAWQRWRWRISTEVGLPVRRPLTHAPTSDLRDILGDRTFDVAWVMTLPTYLQVDVELRRVARSIILDVADWPGEWPGLEAPRIRELLSGPNRADAVHRFKLADRLRRDAGEARRAVRAVDAAVCSNVPANAPTALKPVVNAYPVHPFVGARPVGHPPRVLFAGTYGYGPNVEAVEVLVHDILPLLRSGLGSLQVRIVGRHPQNIAHLQGHPDVEIMGYVDEIGQELAAADLAVVPLRRGTGTRLKILEAWSYQVPVVSTSVGAMGLGAVSGRELLIADEVQPFAAACARALKDKALRARLVAHGHEHLKANFSDQVLDAQIRDVLEDVATRRD